MNFSRKFLSFLSGNLIALRLLKVPFAEKEVVLAIQVISQLV
jgi:hypothetical protein